MIRFGLACESGHEFEAWFRNGEDFEQQNGGKLVSCPHCGSHKVGKALMAPAVATNRKKAQMALAADKRQKKVLGELKALSAKIRQNADYVGDRFAEEARRIHFGETQARGIYGEATVDEAKDLAEDGVDFMALPVFPEDRN